uniref:tRNA-intron lyase n=1 Tax=Arcella intermedia TaxID=1963864 RepID=A0A6B2LWI8_9EUKA
MEGSKYGAHYTVYAGDPSCFHGLYIVIVKDTEENFTLLEVVTLTRLADSIKKQVLLAYLDNDGTVKYHQIEWLGVT